MEHARQVGVHELVPDLVGHVLQRSGAHDAGVRNHDVETSEAAHGFFDGGAHCGGIPDVHRDRKTGGAELPDQFGRVTEVVFGT